MKPFIMTLVAGVVFVAVGCLLFITGYKPAGHVLLIAGLVAEAAAVLLLVGRAMRRSTLV